MNGAARMLRTPAATTLCADRNCARGSPERWWPTLDVPLDDEIRRQLAEVRYLDTSVGPTGLLALQPLQVSPAPDAWHRFSIRCMDVSSTRH